MDAVLYLKEFKRMCDEQLCNACPITKEYAKGCSYISEEERVAFVKKWSKEHPIKRNAEKFRDVFDIGVGDLRHMNTMECLEWMDKPYIDKE